MLEALTLSIPLLTALLVLLVMRSGTRSAAAGEPVEPSRRARLFALTDEDLNLDWRWPR